MTNQPIDLETMPNYRPLCPFCSVGIGTSWIMAYLARGGRYDIFECPTCKKRISRKDKTK